jgi:hypothetical protein
MEEKYRKKKGMVVAMQNTINNLQTNGRSPGGYSGILSRSENTDE